MKRKLRWNLQFPAQSNSQERSNMAFEWDAPKAARPSTLRVCFKERESTDT